MRGKYLDSRHKFKWVKYRRGENYALQNFHWAKFPSSEISTRQHFLGAKSSRCEIPPDENSRRLKFREAKIARCEISTLWNSARQIFHAARFTHSETFCCEITCGETTGHGFKHVDTFETVNRYRNLSTLSRESMTIAGCRHCWNRLRFSHFVDFAVDLITNWYCTEHRRPIRETGLIFHLNCINLSLTSRPYRGWTVSYI